MNLGSTLINLGCRQRQAVEAHLHRPLVRCTKGGAPGYDKVIYLCLHGSNLNSKD